MNATGHVEELFMEDDPKVTRANRYLIGRGYIFGVFVALRCQAMVYSREKSVCYSRKNGSCPECKSRIQYSGDTLYRCRFHNSKRFTIMIVCCRM